MNLIESHINQAPDYKLTGFCTNTQGDQNIVLSEIIVFLIGVILYLSLVQIMYGRIGWENGELFDDHPFLYLIDNDINTCINSIF